MNRNLWFVAFALCGLFALPSFAEPQQPHYLQHGNMAPGVIGQEQLIVRPSSANYVQHVKIVVPKESRVSIWNEGGYQDFGQGSCVVGMQIGNVYRLKITEIPGHPGDEIFPSIELISRLYPPEGQASNFPIQVHVPIEDLKQALKGTMVTRVVYLEDPLMALPYKQGKNEQPYFDVGLGQDPLRIARRLGRSMVITRLGSRVPSGPEQNEFNFGAPPVTVSSTGSNAGYSKKSSSRQVAFEQIESPGHVLSDQMVESQPGQPNQSKPSQACDPQAAQMYETQPRQIYGGCQPCDVCPNPGVISLPMIAPIERKFRAEDEYLCDGGDRKLGVVVDKDWNVLGLDIEDTIGHYDTEDGRRLVEASNRVCIYAPRFAAVRKLSGAIGATTNEQLVNVRDIQGTLAQDVTDFSSTTLQNLQPGIKRKAISPGALRDRTRGVTADNTTDVMEVRDQFAAYEDFQIIRYGKIDNAEKARLSIAIEAARAWNGYLAVQAIVDNRQVSVVRDALGVQVQATVDGKRYPKLRIVKVADKKTAESGDEVSFTLSYTNVSDATIGNVTLIDNLTNRLEYIDGSQTCTQQANFLSEENSGGSLVLRWEIDAPLEAGEGGIIRFKCKVR